MPLPPFPTRTDGSFGRDKSDLAPATDLEKQLQAIEYDNVADWLIAVIGELGDTDGSTPGSVWETLQGGGVIVEPGDGTAAIDIDLTGLPDDCDLDVTYSLRNTGSSNALVQMRWNDVTSTDYFVVDQRFDATGSSNGPQSTILGTAFTLGGMPLSTSTANAYAEGNFRILDFRSTSRIKAYNGEQYWARNLSGAADVAGESIHGSLQVLTGAITKLSIITDAGNYTTSSWVMVRAIPRSGWAGGGGGGGGAIAVEDEGFPLTVAATKFNFVGTGVTATEPVADEITVTIPGGAAVIVEDEGTPLTTAVTKLNFVGLGVTATEPVADEITVTIPGGTGQTNTVAGATGITNTGDNVDAVLAPTYGSSADTICEGDDARLSDDRTADGVRTATTVVSVSASAAPSSGDVLKATSSTTATWQAEAGGGTLDDTVTGGTPDNDVTIPAANPIIFRDDAGGTTPLSIIKANTGSTPVLVTAPNAAHTSITTDNATDTKKIYYRADGMVLGSGGATTHSYTIINEAKVDAAKGDSLTLEAGTNAGAGDGGNLILDAGEGAGAGADGIVQVGVNFGSEIELGLGVTIAESTDHPVAPVAGKGQLWVKDDATQKLIFTDDAGTDVDLTATGAGGTLDGTITGGTPDNDVIIPAANPVIFRDNAADLTPLTITGTNTTDATPSLLVTRPSESDEAIVVEANSADYKTTVRGKGILFGDSGGSVNNYNIEVEQSVDAGSGANVNIYAGGHSGAAAGGDLSLRAGNSISGTDGSIFIGTAWTTETRLGPGITITESADHAVAPASGYGQSWVRNDTPNTPMFTNDDGGDVPLTRETIRITAEVTPAEDLWRSWHYNDGFMNDAPWATAMGSSTSDGTTLDLDPSPDRWDTGVFFPSAARLKSITFVWTQNGAHSTFDAHLDVWKQAFTDGMTTTPTQTRMLRSGAITVDGTTNKLYLKKYTSFDTDVLNANDGLKIFFTTLDTNGHGAIMRMKIAIEYERVA